MKTPGEQIKWALEQRGVSAAEFGRQLGVTRSAVSQWWSESNPASPHKRAERISDCLNLNLDWLLTGRGEPLREDGQIAGSGKSGNSGPAEGIDIAGARLVGVAEGEVWREGCHPSIGDTHQFAFEVRGSSADRMINPGEYVICVNYRQARPAGPQPRDIVVAKKRRGATEYKIFIARLHYCEGTWELQYESNNTRWQQERPIRLSKDFTRDTFDQCHVEIVGYVLGALRVNQDPLFDVIGRAAAQQPIQRRRRLHGSGSLSSGSTRW